MALNGHLFFLVAICGCIFFSPMTVCICAFLLAKAAFIIALFCSWKFECEAYCLVCQHRPHLLSLCGMVLLFWRVLCLDVFVSSVETSCDFIFLIYILFSLPFLSFSYFLLMHFFVCAIYGQLSPEETVSVRFVFSCVLSDL